MFYQFSINDKYFGSAEAWMRFHHIIFQVYLLLPNCTTSTTFDTFADISTCIKPIYFEMTLMQTLNRANGKPLPVCCTAQTPRKQPCLLK